VGCRIWRSSLGVKTEGNESKDGIYNEGTEGCRAQCEAESKLHGTATLFRCILAAVLKSLSKK
jgi:hypothetical protein